jgi:hypothetical protein
LDGEVKIPTPEPKPALDSSTKLLYALLAGFLVQCAAVGYVAWDVYQGREPTPEPGPVVVEPVKPTPEDSTAETNGKRNDAIKASLIGIIKHGNGTHTLTFQPDGFGKAIWTVSVSGGVNPTPPPTPVPPGPTPPPTPPIPPDPTGPLTILLVRESGDSTPEMAMLIRDLRTGPVADYLKSKQHALGVLDTNAKDPDGKPSLAVEEWRPHFSGLTLPALVVYDPTTKRVLSKQAITPATTANQIMEAIKKDGG